MCLSEPQAGSSLPNSVYRISHDGQWIAGLLNNKDQIALYSTAPLIRWPGYLFILIALVILFWRTPNAHRLAAYR